jgi:DNA-directed RNA polymerase specialized sigma24 family protein
MLRTFAGLSEPEIAELHGVSIRTVEREWRFARAWLARELGA